MLLDIATVVMCLLNIIKVSNEFSLCVSNPRLQTALKVRSSTVFSTPLPNRGV